jgi:hypothetical protein
MSTASFSIAYASPHITADDWAAGRHNDIDIFEDQMQTWLFDQAVALAVRDHSGPAMLALITPYFEAIACYLAGQSSRHNETCYLKSGIHAVIPSLPTDAIDLFVTEVRHGFAHEAVFRKVAIHHGNPRCPSFAVLNGLLYIDPWWMLARARQHFNEYVVSLRRGDPPDRLVAFEKFMAIRKAR